MNSSSSIDLQKYIGRVQAIFMSMFKSIFI